jgi:hypothetical protein
VCTSRPLRACAKRTSPTRPRSTTALRSSSPQTSARSPRATNAPTPPPANTPLPLPPPPPPPTGNTDYLHPKAPRSILTLFAMPCRRTQRLAGSINSSSSSNTRCRRSSRICPRPSRTNRTSTPYRQIRCASLLRAIRPYPSSMARAAKPLCPSFRTPTSARSRGRSTGAIVGPALARARRCGGASLRCPSSTDASEDSDSGSHTFCLFVWSSFPPPFFGSRSTPTPPPPTLVPGLPAISFFCLLPILPLSDDGYPCKNPRTFLL